MLPMISAWKTIDSGISESLFLIRDDTGECVVDPEGAEVTPSSSETWYSTHAHWNGHGLAPRSRLIPLGSKDYRLSESRVDVGADLYLLGRFASVSGLDDLPNSREELRNILVEWKRNPKKLLQRFDSDGDGRIDEKEWAHAIKVARKEVLELRTEVAKQPMTHIMGRPHNSRRPYIISTISQHDMVKRFALYGAGSILLFLVGGSVVTWLVTIRFGLLL